jgi:hypothetical protein
MIYSMRNLQQLHHKIEYKLDACEKYYWTLRARFSLDGNQRVTEWAGVYGFAPFVGYKPWELYQSSGTLILVNLS